MHLEIINSAGRFERKLAKISKPGKVKSTKTRSSQARPDLASASCFVMNDALFLLKTISKSFPGDNLMCIRDHQINDL